MKPKLKAMYDDTLKENRAFFITLTSPDGKIVLDALTRYPHKLLQKSSDGRVDAYAMAYAAGQLDFINLILEKIERGKLAR